MHENNKRVRRKTAKNNKNSTLQKKLQYKQQNDIPKWYIASAEYTLNEKTRKSDASVWAYIGYAKQQIWYIYMLISSLYNGNKH